MKIHHLKIAQEYFILKMQGVKSFEIRYDDRGYEVGDILHLVEVDATCNETGRSMKQTVSYLLDDERFLQKGYVILAGEIFDLDL